MGTLICVGGKPPGPAERRLPPHLRGPYEVGERHRMTYRLGCHLWDGRSKQDLSRALHEWSPKLCTVLIGSPNDPHGDRESDIDRIVEDVCKLEPCKKGATPLSEESYEFLREAAASVVWGRVWKGRRGKGMRKMLAYCLSTVARHGGTQRPEGIAFDTSERQASLDTRLSRETVRNGLDTLCDLGLLRCLWKSNLLDQASVYLLPYSLVPGFSPPVSGTPDSQVVQLFLHLLSLRGAS